MSNHKLKLKYNAKGQISNKQFPEAIKAVLLELENGASSKEIIEKYKISRLQTLQEWQNKYGVGKTIMPDFPSIPLKTKQLIVYEINSGALTINEAVSKYQVSTGSISNWLKQYSCENERNMQKDASKESTPSIDHSAKKVIEELQLKILGLETMIDIAEVQFKIEIRKKSGTKQ